MQVKLKSCLASSWFVEIWIMYKQLVDHTYSPLSHTKIRLWLKEYLSTLWTPPNVYLALKE